MGADLVAHGGDVAACSFAHTLVLTDISSGWTECVALPRETMPFPLRGVDTDNGSEFVDEVLLPYWNERKIEFTRSRPWRKDDVALREVPQTPKQATEGAR